MVKNKIKNFKRKNYYSRSHWEKTVRVDPFVIRDKKFFNWITMEEFISTAKIFVLTFQSKKTAVLSLLGIIFYLSNISVFLTSFLKCSPNG